MLKGNKMLKNILTIAIFVGITSTASANTISFNGAIAEGTCSTESEYSSCRNVYKTIKDEDFMHVSAEQVSDLLNSEKNDFGAVSVEKIEGANAAVVLVNYY